MEQLYAWLLHLFGHLLYDVLGITFQPLAWHSCWSGEDCPAPPALCWPWWQQKSSVKHDREEKTRFSSTGPKLTPGTEEEWVTEVVVSSDRWGRWRRQRKDIASSFLTAYRLSIPAVSVRWLVKDDACHTISVSAPKWWSNGILSPPMGASSQKAVEDQHWPWGEWSCLFFGGFLGNPSMPWVSFKQKHLSRRDCLAM